jgi:hypothetical protein
VRSVLLLRIVASNEVSTLRRKKNDLGGSAKISKFPANSAFSLDSGFSQSLRLQLFEFSRPAVLSRQLYIAGMAKPRTKKRTHVRVNDAATGPGKAGATNRAPKSMVIRMGAGEVGSSVGQLVKDVRAMMEPDTASRLKVRMASLHSSSQTNNF